MYNSNQQACKKAIKLADKLAVKSLQKRAQVYIKYI